MLLNIMSEQFDKVLDLAQKLKGPMVVYDKQGGKHLVILGIDEFAQYFDSNKKNSIESKTTVDTNSAQVPELKVEVGNGDFVQESRVDVLPEELTPVEPEALPVEEEVLNKPKSLVSATSIGASGQQWHRLGDVIRRVRPEIASQDEQKPVPFQAHDEPVFESDEPNFLEEPNP